MTRTRATAALLAALLAGVAAPATRAGGCAALRTSGPWALVHQPAGTWATDAVAVPGPGGTDTLYTYQVGLGMGRELLRSTDNGCTWTTAMSLDAVGTPTDVARLEPEYRIVTATAVPGGRGKPATLYVLAGDDGTTLGVTLPSVTVASSDGGRSWTVHQPSPADLAGDYPRCTRDGFGTTRLRVGPDPSTVHLRCRIGALGDAYNVANCAEAYYVSRDRGATWTPVHGRLRDPAGVTRADLGCGRAPVEPVPSPVSARVVWDLDLETADRPARLVVSHDDGGTYAEYAPTAGPLRCQCGFAVAEAARRTPVAAMWNHDDVYVRAGGGAFTRVARPKPWRGRLGHIAMAAFVTDARGTTRLLVAYGVEQPISSEAFLLDLATRRWRALPLPPKRADLSAAWTGNLLGRVLSPPGAPRTWFATPDGGLVRYSG